MTMSVTLITIRPASRSSGLRRPELPLTGHHDYGRRAGIRRRSRRDQDDDESHRNADKGQLPVSCRDGASALMLPAKVEITAGAGCFADTDVASVCRDGCRRIDAARAKVAMVTAHLRDTLRRPRCCIRVTGAGINTLRANIDNANWIADRTLTRRPPMALLLLPPNTSTPRRREPLAHRYASRMYSLTGDVPPHCAACATKMAAVERNLPFRCRNGRRICRCRYCRQVDVDTNRVGGVSPVPLPIYGEYAHATDKNSGAAIRCC